MFFRLDKSFFIVYNSSISKGNDEEEYTGDRIFRELPRGARQYEGPAEVASEPRVPTAMLSSMRRDPHVTGGEVCRPRRVRDNSRIQVVTRTLVRPEPKGLGGLFYYQLRVQS